MDNLNRYSKTELSKLLQDALKSGNKIFPLFERNFHFPTPPVQAAILVPFVYVEKKWSLLFIRRSLSNDPHSGQVAFPGGRMEQEDTSPEITSLREAQEEIGLSPEHVEIIGKLPSLLTVTNYEIHPIVGIIPYPYPFRPSQSEVQKIFTIPLDWLADSTNYRVEERNLPAPVGRIPTIYYRPYQDEILWGASAQIVHNLLRLINAQAPSTSDEA
jgi:8-oxo-dGTP pyrophosphatase MutT (NUDIX family)